MRTLLLSVLILATGALFAQPVNRPAHAGDILQMLDAVSTNGRVLYIAAHPDDENTRLITWLAQAEHVDVAYLSLTRGDGGQNLIGTELGAELGVIRTQELLAARAVDGGSQYFSRANDFGYSKTHEETLTIWREDSVLADMVRVIRTVRPHVLITRFPPLHYDYPTHGHHSASALLAEKAFEAAGDPDAYTDQLDVLTTWQPTRLLWNTSTWFYRRTNTELDTTGKIMVDVGAYVALLGLSCSEIAAHSRSQHKSQGFGAAGRRGTQIEYLEHVLGAEAKTSIWDGIDRSWDAIPGGAEAKRALDAARNGFDPRDPSAITPHLLTAYGALDDRHPDAVHKRAQLTELLKAVLGLHLRSTTETASVQPGGDVVVTTTLLNRSDVPVRIERLVHTVTGTEVMDAARTRLDRNHETTWTDTLNLPRSLRLSHPYWLREPLDGIGMYRVADGSLRGLPEAPSVFRTRANLDIDGTTIPVEWSWRHITVDRVRAELIDPVAVARALTVDFVEPVVLLTSDGVREVSIRVKAWTDAASGRLDLVIIRPDGSEDQLDLGEVTLSDAGDETLITASVPAMEQPGVHTVHARIDGDRAHGHTVIDHDHLPRRVLWPEATAKWVRLDVERTGDRIGYIMGAGDKVAENLTRIGYEVVMLDEETIHTADLDAMDALLIGIRAYNTEEWLPGLHDELKGYVERGGHLVVQYQTTWGLLTDEIGPAPFTIGRDRITVEEAPLRALVPDHPILTTPNRLTDADWDGWVQERGLYFATDWSEGYTPLLEGNDPGEAPTRGALLVAHHGEGSFIYTGLSFFRELPAGVPGAFRLLANILSYEPPTDE